jgi:tight adherence protein C
VELTASFLIGLAAAWLVWQLLSLERSETDIAIPEWHFESARRVKLRAASATYRRFELLVDEMLSMPDLFVPKPQRVSLERSLRLAKNPVPWKADDLAAVRTLEGFAFGLIVGLVFFLIFGVALGFVSAVITALLYRRLMLKSIVNAAGRRLTAFKIKLPFAIDLLALMIEAGAHFNEGLAAVVSESSGHPVGDEFGNVLNRLSAGESTASALNQLDSRCADDDVHEFAFAIVKGEELGTPLSASLKRQADRIRLKRTQWAEKAVGEAQVQIVFPGMVIMLACLVIVIAPYLLPLVAGTR